MNGHVFLTDKQIGDRLEAYNQAAKVIFHTHRSSVEQATAGQDLPADDARPVVAMGLHHF